MSSDGSRRFTDREVATVLRKASEIEESEGSSGSGGLSMDDLQEIAREVGIAPEAIAKAVDRLDTGRDRTPLLGGAPSAHKAVLAGGVIMPWDVSAAGSILAFIAAALAGGAAGRFVWNRISARSRARVERLATALSRHAYDASKKGLVVPDEKSES